MAEKRTRVPAGLLTAGILFASHPVMAEPHGGGAPFGGSHVGRRGLGRVTEHKVISTATLNLAELALTIHTNGRGVRRPG